MLPRARASRELSGLWATFTMWAAPEASKWVIWLLDILKHQLPFIDLNRRCYRNEGMPRTRAVRTNATRPMRYHNTYKLLLPAMPSFEPYEYLFARLFVSGRELADAISRRVSGRLTAVLAVALLLINISAQAGTETYGDLPSLGDNADIDLPWDIEKRLGRKIMSKIRNREPSYLNDAEVEEYLLSLARRLTDERRDPPMHLFVLMDRSINAFAMYGGYIGVHSGLFKLARSESELASVIAHEIAHVTQRHLARQIPRRKNLSLATFIATALALAAARSNPQAAQAAMVTAQAGAIQGYLNFSREFEREADRVGLARLMNGGFYAYAMPEFFIRLQKSTHQYGADASAYLRTHPLTLERVSDLQNRVPERSRQQDRPGDELDFYLVRAKLQALEETPVLAVQKAKAELSQPPLDIPSAALHYALAVAQFRARNWRAAEDANNQARLAAKKSGLTLKKTGSPLIDRLAAEIKLKMGAKLSAIRLYEAAAKKWNHNQPIILGLAEALLVGKRYSEARRLLESEIQRSYYRIRLYRQLARTGAKIGKASLQHSAMAEAYFEDGRLGEAVEQLELAQKAGDANFYDSSSIDARLRQLRRQLREENLPLSSNN